MPNIVQAEHTDDGLGELAEQMPMIDRDDDEPGEDLADLAQREAVSAPDLEVAEDGTDPAADPDDPGPQEADEPGEDLPGGPADGDGPGGIDEPAPEPED